MGPMDYSAGWNQPPSKAYVTKSEKKKRSDERAVLADKCVALLQERGAMTTVQLARELHSTTPTISAVMREVKGVMRDNVKDSERK